MSEVLNIKWNDGADLINTGGAYEFTSALNVAVDQWEKKSDCGGLNGAADYAKLSVNGINRVCIKDLILTTILYSWEPFKITTDGLNNGQEKTILRYRSGSGIVAFLKVVKSGAQLILKGIARDTGGGQIEFGSINISAGMYYQAELYFERATLNGCAFKLWNESGMAQIGTTQIYSGTTRAITPDEIALGSVSGNNQLFMNFGGIKADNADWVGPEVIPTDPVIAAGNGGVKIGVSIGF